MDQAVDGQRQNQAIGSYQAIRNAVGWLTFGLPLAVFFGFWVIFSHHRFSCLLPVGDNLPDSLSGYYYSHMRDFFVGSMCAAGVFLFFYREDAKSVRWLTNVAGLCAVLIALFPTKLPSLASSSCGPLIPKGTQSAPSWATVVHAVCLVVLMAAIAAVIVLWLRKETKSRSKNWYLVCVIFIFLAGALAVIQQAFFDEQAHRLAPWLFYAEVMAFLAFGVAWFVNGRPLMQLWTGLRDAGKSLGDTGKSLARAITKRRNKQPASAGG